MLWQLPEQLTFDPATLASFCELLPRTTGAAAALAAQHDAKLPEGRALTIAEVDQPMRHALEFRSTTFCVPEAFAILREHGVSGVVADTARRWPLVTESCSDFRYVRLHGDTELYTSGYSAEALDTWAQRCLSWAYDDKQDVYVYFDNDARGHAPHDAVALLDRITRRTGAAADRSE